MIKIGDFARLAGISINALRHYDEEGLLSPCFVHPDSGYRYFESEQLRQLHRILLLKELGLSLSEIREVNREALSVDEMKPLLARKRADAESRIMVASDQIRKIDHHLSTIEKEYSMSQLEVIRKTVTAISVAAIHLEIATNDQVGEVLGLAYCELYEFLEQNQLASRGPCLAVWESSPKDLVDESVDAAVPVDSRPIEHPRIAIKMLPPVEVAAVVHVGPFSEFRQCHVALSEWLAANHCKLDGPYREIYHTAPGPNATTEVQYPITAE
jgi:DNA-binding transcriptional MerR regulator